MGGAVDRVRQLIDQLRPDSLLRAFDTGVLEDLLRHARQRTLARGEEVIRQGDTGDFIVCPLSGHLKISIVSANGREIILGYAEPGDVLGEMSFIDGEPRSATVSAVEPVDVLVLPGQSIKSALFANPEAMLRMMRTMATRIRLLDLTLESDRAFSLGPRLARVFVRLLPPDGQCRLRLDLSQGDLGAFEGISRENVNRQLGEWEATGLLQRNGRKIDVLNQDFFRDLADFGEDD